MFKNFDLSELSYSEFVRFLFDRRLLNENESFTEVFCPGVTFFTPSKPEVLLEQFERLCNDFHYIGSTYSMQQIDQAIWALFGGVIELEEQFWNRAIPRNIRDAAVLAMAQPFQSYVLNHPSEELEPGFFMWWDIILGSFWMRFEWSPLDVGSVFERLDGEDRSLLQVMFVTLCQILQMPDQRCQNYALHGLGHLHHPDVAGIVQSHIDANRSHFDVKEVLWLEQCRDGTVM